MSENIPHRRRREKKTNYDQRLNLLKGGEPRLVVRKHLRNTIAQLISWEKQGDETLIQAEAQELREYGWKGHCGNLPAAYLTGYLLGRRAEEENIERAILDTGLQESTAGNRIYAVVKGAKDWGLQVPVGNSVIPSEERVQGKHIEKYASEMDESEKGKHFSNLIERDLDPEKLSNHFQEIKERLEESGE